MSGDRASINMPHVKCPTCGKDARYDGTNPWRPFCSERCRLVDLGAWASESYRIPETSPRDGLADAPVIGDED